MKKGVWFFGFVLILLIIMGIFFLKPDRNFGFTKEKQQEISLGFVGDLNGQRSEQALAGIQVAIDELNTKGPYHFTLHIYDSQNDTEFIRQQFKKLVTEDHALAIMSSHARMQDLPNEYKIPTIFFTEGRQSPARDNSFYWEFEMSRV